MLEHRLLRHRQFDDGLNAWSMTDIVPAPALIPSIRAYCDYSERTGGFTARRELPHPEGVMIVNLGEPVSIIGGDGHEIRLAAGDAFVAGTHLAPAISRSRGAQAGVHVFIALENLRRFIGAPMCGLLNRAVPLDAIIGRQARELGERLVAADTQSERVGILDAALTRLFDRTKPLCAQQTHALHLLRTRPDFDVADIARDIGWSSKHLANRVRDVVGVGPRSFRRLLRFQRLHAALDDASPPDWADLAGMAGYYDQSHLINEFREFTGLTPRVFLARRLAAGGGLIEA